MTPSLRIRQIVFACESEDSFNQLAFVLGLGTPFHDKGVAEFGLVNAVYAFGDQFIEIVVPKTDTAPARRFLNRNGEGGYMAIFQVPDIEQARARLDGLNLRRVWNIDLPDISASHIHPADIGGAIVSIDDPRPASAWRWGGEHWEGQSVEGAVTGIQLTTPVPGKLPAKWADALGAECDGHEFETSDGPVTFLKGETEGISGFSLQHPDPQAVIRRAEEAGLETVGESFLFADTRIDL